MLHLNKYLRADQTCSVLPAVLVRGACAVTSAFQDTSVKNKEVYFSREYIRVSNTITQKRFTSGNQHIAVFAEAFLNPYLISLEALIKLIY